MKSILPATLALTLCGCAAMAPAPALRAPETCAEMAERMAPFNPQTQERLRRECEEDR